MDMSLIYMGRYDKLMLAPGKLHCQLIADPIGFLRADLPWLEGLKHPIHDNIMVWGLSASGNLVV